MPEQTQGFATPDWVRHAVFYQIFPERFANGDPSNDPENVQPWGTAPTLYNFMGGDLQGIIDKLDYLVELGINALYLNPIFQATSSHKYNTFDYMRIDSSFGDLDTFHRLIDAAHQRNIKVVLDCVFNHCGRGFFAFNDIMENGEQSPYLNWFHIEQFPLHAYDDDGPLGYKAWWDYRSLPKFNTDHPPVRQYLLNVARYWIEQGADGWRLDVPNEIADHNFWREFRDVVKAVNPDAYIVGEIWNDATAWLDGSQFDAVMNYLFRDACRDFFARGTMAVDVFDTTIRTLLKLYPREVTEVQLNLLGSHDTARILTEAQGNIDRVRLATLFQMTFPGAPCVYYGDEIGLEGENDPHCRACFPWDSESWALELQEWIKQCIALRHEYTALRTGEFASLLADINLNTYGYARWDNNDMFVVALNNSDQEQSCFVGVKGLPNAGKRYRDIWTGSEYIVEKNRIIGLKLAAHSGIVLQRIG